ncbi:hypothetical protein [Sphingomonas sp. BAUL-RG-20F-R05-02]|uniref:hypothetical protein n=1 Tax=Sphingomonas sp. BAUL-RG-20F-R05-02 TaxID=2914830 RepID=UPI001F572177|nr:hypothetical protein [Sphingomonas sp. BAUL-RG-20F-R05-02]
MSRRYVAATPAASASMRAVPNSQQPTHQKHLFFAGKLIELTLLLCGKRRS